jgi:hypothetical protein
VPRSGSVDVLPRFWCFLSLSLFLLARAQGRLQSGGLADDPPPEKLPTGVLLVKGAWSSASDSVTPVPEGGQVIPNGYTNQYFGLTYPLSPDWTQKYSGPPPSDSGYYVLAQIRPADRFKGASRGTILISAQDLFFTPTPAENAREMLNYAAEHLEAEYKVEQPPTQVTISGHSFVRLDYGSPIAALHWRVLATEIRCHIVEFVFTSRDTELAEGLIQGMNQMTLPSEADVRLEMGGGDAPVCIKDYATGANVIHEVDPLFTERRFNPVPVRIIVDKQGKVRHIHLLSAFPDQARAITTALSQWRLKPYLHDGRAFEVETGILFGHALRPTTPSSTERSFE